MARSIHEPPTTSRGIFRRTMQMVVIVTVFASALLTIPAPAASAQQIDQGGRLLPFADLIIQDVGGGAADLVDNVDEYPAVDSDNVRLDNGVTTGFHRVKFGVMNSDTDSLCATVRARATNVSGDVRVSFYSNSTRISTSDWRPLSGKWGNHVFASDASAVALTGQRLSVKVEMRRDNTSGTVQYSQVFARMDCDQWANAKVLGYAFGDGNFNPWGIGGLDSTLSFKAPSATMGRDFVENGCAAGYEVRERINNSTVSASLCGGPADVSFANPQNQPRLEIAGFSYPYSADGSPSTAAYKAFVEQATASERRAFISGVVPTESKAALVQGRYLIDDQFVFGAYDDVSNGITRENACDRIHWRMNNFKKLLQGGDFPGSDTFAATAGSSCKIDNDGRDEIMRVFIEPQFACRLNSQYGYEFAVFGRVPGATQVNGKWVQPAPC